jgi:hypothetical protein
MIAFTPFFLFSHYTSYAPLCLTVIMYRHWSFLIQWCL